MSWKYLNKKPISEERKFTVLRRPLITEKYTIVSQYSHFAFEVAADANKHEVKLAVESLFKVHVVKVNILNEIGKQKSFKGRLGQQKGIRKAIVVLKAGETIDVGIGV